MRLASLPRRILGLSRVRDIVEWSGGRSSSPISRNRRSASESATRHAIPRSLSIPSKYLCLAKISSGFGCNEIASIASGPICYNAKPCSASSGCAPESFSASSTNAEASILENLALRQQLAVLKRRHPRPRLTACDRLFWVCARRFWRGSAASRSAAACKAPLRRGQRWRALAGSSAMP